MARPLLGRSAGIYIVGGALAAGTTDVLPLTDGFPDAVLGDCLPAWRNQQVCEQGKLWEPSRQSEVRSPN